jgi:hypothetical protein
LKRENSALEWHLFHEGTLGGIFTLDGLSHTVTAGHCIKDDAREKTASDAPRTIFRCTSSSLDCAFIPLNLPDVEKIMFANPWYIDDDRETNPDFFGLVQEISGDKDDFPFYHFSKFPPGTQVVKLGLTTGNTAGQFVGLRDISVEVKENGVKVLRTVENDVVVQWEPGQRFAAGGDSGSVYYAKLTEVYNDGLCVLLYMHN